MIRSIETSEQLGANLMHIERLLVTAEMFEAKGDLASRDMYLDSAMQHEFLIEMNLASL